VVPAYATPSERHLLREVAEAAGAASPILLENTVAAALGLGVDLMAPRGHMVLDVGAGGFAAAVLCLGGTHVARTGRTGGDSIDEAIAEWVRQHFALAISRGSAERLKEAIGGVGPCRSPGRMEVHGQDTASGLPRAVEVDARDLAGVIEGVLRPVVAAAKDALAQASAELVADVAESGIWLTGGTACLAGLADWLAAETGVFVHLAEHPHETVVAGARRALSGEIREDHVVLRPRVV